MLLFLDTADERQIKYWADQGVLDGVTTNPTVLRQSNTADAAETLANLAALVTPGVLHAEVTAACGDEIVSQGLRLAAMAENIAVKVPILDPDGQPCLAEMAGLARAGVVVNCTACLSFGQVVLAAKAGARYISVLVGRIEDEGGDAATVLETCRRWLDMWHPEVKLIAASLRGPGDVSRSMAAGAHCVTVPPPVLAKLADHKYARHTVKEFLADARLVPGSL
jgi:transaldolase